MAGIFIPPPMGWVNSPVAVRRAMDQLEAGTNGPAVFAAVKGGIEAAEDDSPVFFWQAEEKVLGKRLPTWDQKSVGSCVSFGWGRACQDLILWQLACGQPGQWPGHEVATEPIYGGSRYEVGGGTLTGRGDGSVGAWAAKWVQGWGLLLRTKYALAGGTFDLSVYDEQRCRQYGDGGCPDPLEPEAKIHPVSAVAQVGTGDEAWTAVGGGKPVPVCSDVGFASPLVGGFCAPAGTWGHCMAIRGRFVHPTRGKCFVIGNSWADYLNGGDPRVQYVGADGKTAVLTLPDGHFATTLATVDEMVGQGDTFAVAGAKGWEAERLTWTPFG